MPVLDAEKHAINLRVEIEKALLALGSYKQITEKFPDAAQYLPAIGAKSMALIPNLDGLKQKIKNQ